jgi:hypothetical protein
MSLKGATRGKAVRTTISDRAAPCPLDRVNRQFQAPLSVPGEYSSKGAAEISPG